MSYCTNNIVTSKRTLVFLRRGLRKNYSTDFHNIRWKGAPRATKEIVRFCCNSGHTTLGLGLWSLLGGAKSHHATHDRFTWCSFHSDNNFARLAALAEVCALLDTILVTLRAISCGAVHCNRPCLCVCVCLFVCGSVTTINRNCVHRSSPNWVCV